MKLDEFHSHAYSARHRYRVIATSGRFHWKISGRTIGELFHYLHASNKTFKLDSVRFLK